MAVPNVIWSLNMTDSGTVSVVNFLSCILNNSFQYLPFLFLKLLKRVISVVIQTFQ